MRWLLIGLLLWRGMASGWAFHPLVTIIILCVRCDLWTVSNGWDKLFYLWFLSVSLVSMTLLPLYGACCCGGLCLLLLAIQENAQRTLEIDSMTKNMIATLTFCLAKKQNVIRESRSKAVMQVHTLSQGIGKHDPFAAWTRSPSPTPPSLHLVRNSCCVRNFSPWNIRLS